MSPDNVFASQMWSWPDPVLKRDEFGRIIFLNAAFLSLYGGRVEDWQGNTVMGWPAPQMSMEINRFETRMPSASGEFVFDWMEYAQGNGQALAIARDVTAFVKAPVQENQPVQAPPQHMDAPHSPQVDPVMPTATQQAEPQAMAPPIVEAPQQAVMQAPPPSQQAPQESMMSMVPDAPIAPPIQAPAEAPIIDIMPAATAPAAVAQATAPQAQPIAEAPSVAAEPPKRDFERRALPIENQDAVLGTNWRDAVIARAVSNDDTEETAEADNSKTQAADTPQPQETGSGYRILLAEDNAINALLTRTLLEAEGCIVDVVEDGALAVEAVKNASYDMIFMDMRMPNMDGLESTRKIRALPNTSGSLPIIALTANAFDDDRNACFDSGMNDFMTKPVSAEELSAMVQTWAAKSKAA